MIFAPSHGATSETLDSARLEFLMTHINKGTFRTILDLGCGKDVAYTKRLATHNMQVIAVDIFPSMPDLPMGVKYMQIEHIGRIPMPDGSVELVWLSHVLEHSCNPCNFLLEIRRVLIDGGLLLVAVPPFKYEIVNHFITGWSVGQLAYVLAGFGFDCTDIQFLEKGYNVLGGGIKQTLLLPPTHFGINGVSIQKVMRYLPQNIQVLLKNQTANEIIRFDGRIKDTQDM